MIVFRQTDRRVSFLWESATQPAARWHGPGEGPAHYFADTPDGAWAEFLRHEEITDPADLPTIRRRLWAIEIGDASAESVRVSAAVATGGRDSYVRCQAEARRLRARGVSRLRAPSAALVPGGAAGTVVRDGLQPGVPRDGVVFVVFGAPDGLTGWMAADAAGPSRELLDRVSHFSPGR